MKIIHICLTGQFNENFTYQDNLLTKYHSLQGHEVYILAPIFKLSEDGRKMDEVTPGVYDINYNIKLIRLPHAFSNSFTKKFRIYKGLLKTLNEIKPDFLFIHGTQFLSIFTVIKFLKSYRKIKVVADSQQDFYYSCRNLLSLNILHKIISRKCTKMIEPFCEKIYGVTPIRCKFLQEVYKVNQNKLELLPLAADDFLIKEIAENNTKSELREKYALDKNDFVLISGGKIDDLKNLHLLIQAFTEENKNLEKKVKLIYFGSFSENISPAVKKIISENTDNKTVINAGWLNSKEINELFFCSDLAVFPGTHSVLWEQAIANKIPCLFNGIEGMHHVNVNENCVIFNGNNIQEIKFWLRTIILDKKKYFNLLKNTILAADLFSYSKQAKKVINDE